MAQYRTFMLASSAALAIMLSGCGGGGGGGGSSIISTPPPPPSPPPPPPPPPPPNFVNIFPNITTTTDFAVLGLQANVLNGSASSLVSSGFAVRFDAASDAYVIDLPSLDPGKFHSTSENNGYWDGRLVSDSGAFLAPGGWGSIFKPSPTNPELVLAHTSFGLFNDYDGFYDYDDATPFSIFAFGTATPAGGVPTTGSATFDAIIAGLTLDTGRTVGGTASLQFNFGAGTLAGSFNPYTFNGTGGQVSLGTYGFVNTVFGVGSTTFSGRLQHAGTPNLGAFNGLFTGPLAQELMAKWTAPYRNPDSSEWSEMFGVLVGKKP